MPLTVPATGKPRLTSEQLTKRFKSLKTFELAKHPLVVAGVRGYYKNAMGAPGVNDRGIYDDAIFVYTPSVMAAFNGNADFCEDLSDVVYGLIRRNFCNDCYEALPNDALKTAIQQLLSWRYQPARG